jgi:SSS family transporter
MAESNTVFQADERIAVTLDELSPLPTNVRGAFVGSVWNGVVVAGGVRTSDGTRAPAADEFVRETFFLPVASDQLQKDKTDAKPGTNAWQTVASDTNTTRAFGGSAVDGNSILCVGGIGPGGLSRNVTRCTVKNSDAVGGKAVTLEWSRLPDLPVATALAAALVKNNKLHVIGGITSLSPVDANAAHWVLDLKPSGGPAAAWKNLGDVPGLKNIVAPCVVIRHDDVAGSDAMHMVGGWSYEGGLEAFRPVMRSWKYLDKKPSMTGWQELAAPPSDAVFRAGVALGPAHWLLVGSRDRGAVESVWGLDADVPVGLTFYTYHTFTDRWVKLSGEQEAGSVAMTGFGTGFVTIDSGKDGGVGTRVWRGAVRYEERHFAMLDYVVLGGYMVALLVIGFWCSRKEHDTAEFFLGSRQIPWWAAGLSMYATGISAISFMSIPAKTYATNWVRFTEPIMGFVAMMVAGYVFVPLLRRLELTTMMEFLEMRFNKLIRFMSSALAVISQVAGRMGVVLLLPSIALEAVTGLDVRWCILFMGVVATLYTVLGGIRAVIWTDVLQFVVFFGGTVLCLLMIAGNIEGGLAGLVETGTRHGKLHTFDWSWDFTSVTVWVMVLWGIADVIGRLGQDTMQRAFATRDARDARRAMVTCAAVSLPGAALFFLVGTGLFVFYRMHPQLLNPTLENDTILPLFVAQQLPAGISGLVIAGLFAAAMSTLDSAMNGVATIVTRDWYSVFHVRATEATKLRVARVITVVCGILGTVMAWYMASLGVRSLWDTFAKMMGLILGVFAGVTALALLTRRANWLGTFLGVLVNVALLPAIKEQVHFLVYGITFLITGFVSGYLFSLLVDIVLSEPVRVRLHLKKDLTGLTVWTPRARV